MLKNMMWLLLLICINVLIEESSAYEYRAKDSYQILPNHRQRIKRMIGRLYMDAERKLMSVWHLRAQYRSKDSYSLGDVVYRARERWARMLKRYTRCLKVKHIEKEHRFVLESLHKVSMLYQDMTHLVEMIEEWTEDGGQLHGVFRRRESELRMDDNKKFEMAWADTKQVIALYKRNDLHKFLIGNGSKAFQRAVDNIQDEIQRDMRNHI